MFRLTRQEIHIVAFILAAFLAGLAIKHWRDARADEVVAVQAP